MVRNTYIYPPAPSMRIIGDIFRYCSANMPKFNCISISGYHMQEAGATADIELGYTLADGLEYIRTGIQAGLDIDSFAPRLSFFWGIGMNHFMEIAKMRAARVLWAKIDQGVPPEEPEVDGAAHALADLRLEPDRAGRLQQRGAHLRRGAGGGAGPHAVAAHQRARRSHRAADRFLGAHRPQHADLPAGRDRHHASVVDPWAGSYYVESLTHELMHKAWHHIQEIEALGGMAKAIETGIPKMRIEEAAARRQARSIPAARPSSASTSTSWRDEEPIDVLDVDNKAVRESQLRRLAQVRARARRRRGGARAGGADRSAPKRARATCWNWPSRRRACAPRWARSPRRSKRCSGGTRP